MNTGLHKSEPTNGKVQELLKDKCVHLAQLCETKAMEWQSFADMSSDPDKVRELEAMASAAFQCAEAIRESV